MKKNSIYNRGLIVLLLILLLVMTGCGASGAERNGVELKGNGSIRAVTVSEFPKEEYNSVLLEEEIREAAESYNEAAERKGVKLLGVSATDDIVRVTMQYAGYEDYAAFNRVGIYYGTVSDGIDAKILTGSTTLKDTEGTLTKSISSLAAEEKDEKARYRIFMTEEALDVTCSLKPVFISDNVRINEDGTVSINMDLSGEELPQAGYVVYKK